MEQMPFEYIRQYYKVPAEFGREIMYCGTRKGIIVEDQGGYIGVNLYDNKPNNITTLHPTFEIEYLGLGKIRAMTRSQKRYREWLKMDSSGTFAEFLGIKKKSKYSPI